jgi:RNA polymerase sigma-70 factor (ECF subfamily)
LRRAAMSDSQYNRINQSALACKAIAGDRDALERLLRSNWRWIRILTAGYTKNACDSDDILQNVCLRVMLKIHTLREPERFRPWLATLVKREALSFIKNIHSARCPEDRGIHPQELPAGVRLIQQEENAIVFKALMSLPEKYRQVVLLKYYNDNRYDEIAETLDITISAVQTRLFRARKMIALVLEKKVNHKIPRG